jgi:hypothetical protein
MHVGGIFYDLAKAFDCVNHEILLSKLHYFGIQGAKYLLELGNNKAWSSTGVNFKAFAFHNLYKWPCLQQ